MKVAKIIAIVWGVANFTLYLDFAGSLELGFIYPFLIMFIWESGIKKLEVIGK